MRISKRLIDSLQPTIREFHVWDDDLPGFGVRMRPSGAASYVVIYRAGSGRSAPVRRVTLGAVGKLAPDEARKLARTTLADAAKGGDPAKAKSTEKGIPTVAVLVERFIQEHGVGRLKPRTLKNYRSLLDVHIRPAFGTIRADKLTRADFMRRHMALVSQPARANLVLALLSAAYNWSAKAGLVPGGVNPTKGVAKLREAKRERFLSLQELQWLGEAIREAETVGVPWEPDPSKEIKHAPKPENRRARIDRFAAAALRLLVFTGARLGEVLNLRWDQVDFGRGLAFLADSKTGQKTLILSPAALAIIHDLPRLGPYVIPGQDPEKPRADLKRPWVLVAKRAGLQGVRLHDLRHTFASFGAGAGLGLPIIGKLLGHTQAATTARYAHLADDPMRLAAERIGSALAAAMGEPSKASPEEGAFIPLRRSRLK